MIGAVACPVCGQMLVRPVERSESADQVVINCIHCGTFRVTGTAAPFLVSLHLPRHAKSAAFAHAIRRAAAQLSDQSSPLLTRDLVNEWWNNAELPTPREQADNLMLWLGNETRNRPGNGRLLNHNQHGAIVGTADEDGIAFIARGLLRQGLLEAKEGDGKIFRLTFDGWDRYEALRRGASAGFTAFMAMKFGDPETDRMYRDCFQHAVAATGFKLLRLDDEPRAGLIDDSLRLAINRARFLIADLSHANNGAYWEAGYAEGLGKTVIYTCEKGAFETNGTHFDTNHHQTVIWEVGQADEAARRLKATIRISIPEAKQED